MHHLLNIFYLRSPSLELHGIDIYMKNKTSWHAQMSSAAIPLEIHRKREMISQQKIPAALCMHQVASLVLSHQTPPISWTPVQQAPKDPRNEILQTSRQGFRRTLAREIFGHNQLWGHSHYLLSFHICTVCLWPASGSWLDLDHTSATCSYVRQHSCAGCKTWRIQSWYHEFTCPVQCRSQSAQKNWKQRRL